NSNKMKENQVKKIVIDEENEAKDEAFIGDKNEKVNDEEILIDSKNENGEKEYIKFNNDVTNVPETIDKENIINDVTIEDTQIDNTSKGSHDVNLTMSLNLSQRDKAVVEIVVSEQFYIKNLDTIRV